MGNPNSTENIVVDFEDDGLIDASTSALVGNLFPDVVAPSPSTSGAAPESGGGTPQVPASSPTQVPPAPTPTVVPPVVPPAVVPAVAPGPVLVPPVAPGTEPVAPVVAAEVTVVAPTAPVVDIVALRNSAAKDFQDKVVFPDAAKEVFLPEQLEILSSLLGQAMVHVYEQAYQAIVVQAPRILEFSQGIKNSAKEYETKFYESFPALKGYETDVMQAMAQYRSVNPTVSFDQTMKVVGGFLLQEKGLQGQTTPPAVPVVGARPVATPFRPAAGAPAGQAAPPTDGTDFAAMASAYRNQE